MVSIIIASMATRGRPTHSPGPIFLTEWMLAKGISDSEMAERLGEHRATIGKWQRYPTRLDPLKIARVAAVLGIWPPQLWVHPGSQQDRIIQAAAPEPGPWTPPETLPKIPRRPKGK
jgi:transcriptional regulator with XRE-family HTH domain